MSSTKKPKINLSRPDSWPHRNCSFFPSKLIYFYLWCGPRFFLYIGVKPCFLIYNGVLFFELWNFKWSIWLNHRQQIGYWKKLPFAFCAASSFYFTFYFYFYLKILFYILIVTLYFNLQYLLHIFFIFVIHIFDAFFFKTSSISFISDLHVNTFIYQLLYIRFFVPGHIFNFFSSTDLQIYLLLF